VPSLQAATVTVHISKFIIIHWRTCDNSSCKLRHVPQRVNFIALRLLEFSPRPFCMFPYLRNTMCLTNRTKCGVASSSFVLRQSSWPVFGRCFFWISLRTQVILTCFPWFASVPAWKSRDIIIITWQLPLKSFIILQPYLSTL
jgi:hypothetical protein